MDAFALQKRDVLDGLSERRMSALAGIDVVSFSYDAFPFSQRLLDLPDDRSISVPEKAIRSAALSGALLARGKWGLRHIVPTIAAHKGPASHRGRFRIVILDDDPPASFRDELRQTDDQLLGPASAIAERFLWWGATVEGPGQVLGPLEDRLLDGRNVGRAPGAAVMLLPDLRLEREYWANSMSIPAYLLEKAPEDRMFRPYVQLRELAFAVQARVIEASNGNEYFLPRFYRNLVAQGTALTSLKVVNEGAQTRTAAMHASYINHISRLDERDRGTPTLDALLSGGYRPGKRSARTPPVFQQVIEARDEICLRLIMEKQGRPHRYLDTDGLNRAKARWDRREQRSIKAVGDPLANVTAHSLLDDYRRWTLEKFRGGVPHEILSSLRKLSEERVFTDASTAQLAERVLEASDYFNWGLSHRGQSRPKLMSMPKSVPRPEP